METIKTCRACAKFVPYPFLLNGEQWGKCIDGGMRHATGKSISVREDFSCLKWEPVVRRKGVNF